MIEDGFAKDYTMILIALGSIYRGSNSSETSNLFKIAHREQCRNRNVTASGSNAHEKRWRKERWPSDTGKHIKEDSK